MVRLTSVRQAQALDKQTQDINNISAEVLMDRAGEKAAHKFSKIFPNKKIKIGVLCGRGNNAADGVVMAQNLMTMGYKSIKLFMLFDKNSWGELLLKKISKIPSKNIYLNMSDDFLLEDNQILIDGIFGIGLSKNIEGSLQETLQKVNLKKIPVISLDVPSGLDADTGEARGVALKAAYTLTFGHAKPGMFIRSGPDTCGKIFCLDIGFSKELSQTLANNYFLIRRTDVQNAFPQRTILGNKTHFGHVKIWAGSPGFWGACVLSARSAYRAGAGYVTIETSAQNTLPLLELPEALLAECQSPEDKYVYAVGPGLGIVKETQDKIQSLYDKNISRVVLDADAITVVASQKLPLHPNWILTPHTGELSRLLNISSEEIEKNRILSVEMAVKKYGCTVVLKGFHTLVGHGDKVYIVPTGNSALAKAGTGDVLTGLIAGFIAQGCGALEACYCGAYIHGLIADQWIKTNAIQGLTPSDLLLEIPRVMKLLSKD